MKKRVLAMLLSALLVANISACGVDVSETNNDTQKETEQGFEENKTSSELYNEALSLLDAGDVYGAYDIFLTISDFADVSEYLDDFVFLVEKYELFDASDRYSTCFYEYDDYGRRTSTRHVYADDPEGTLTSYRYDEKGRSIQKEIKSGSSAEQIFKYTYDEAGRPIRQDYDGWITSVEYDANGNIMKVMNGGYIRERSYDSSGRITEELLKTERGFLLSTTVYEYNEQGDLIKETERENFTGSILSQFDYQYEYDERGNKIRCTGNESDGVREWEYDDQGNQIKYSDYSSDSAFVIFHYKYDENGNEIEQRCEDEKGITHRIFFEYDDYGNLIKRTTDYPNSAEKNYSLTYSYRLSYNPNAMGNGGDPQQGMPVELIGKG